MSGATDDFYGRGPRWEEREYVFPFNAPPHHEEIARLRREARMLREDLEHEREMRKRCEERAYEEGLGDRAKVWRENQVLAATIAALTDRTHPARVG